MGIPKVINLGNATFLSLIFQPASFNRTPISIYTVQMQNKENMLFGELTKSI